MHWDVFRGLLFPFPCWSIKRFFFSIHCENLRKVLEVKLTGVWKVSNSYTCPLWASSNSSTPDQLFLPQPWFLQRVPLWPVVILSICVSKVAVCSMTSLLDRSKESCWSFSLFNFSLLIRMEWWQPSSLHVKLETGRVFFLFSCLFSFHPLEYEFHEGRASSLFLSVAYSCIPHAYSSAWHIRGPRWICVLSEFFFSVYLHSFI